MISSRRQIGFLVARFRKQGSFANNLSQKLWAHPTRHIFAALFAVAILLSSSLAGATADSRRITDALLSDLTVVAQLKGITLDEALRRHGLRERSMPAIDVVVANPAIFADIFQDDTGGQWRLRILYVGTLEQARAYVIDKLDADIPVQWVNVDRSYSELTAIRDEIVALWAKQAESIVEVSIDPETNTVQVTTPHADGSIRSNLRATYGEAVSFAVGAPDEYAACNATNDPEGGSRYACTPWRGGTALQIWDQGYNLECTSTMWARKKANANSKQLITAGHCGNKLGNQTFYHNTFTIGTSIGSSHNVAVQLSDSRRIPAPGYTSGMNWIYETPSVKGYGITSVVANGNQRLNDWVCKHGIGGSPFGRACGQIINADTTIQDPTPTGFVPQREPTSTRLVHSSVMDTAFRQETVAARSPMLGLSLE